jgi:uridine kinase
MPADSANAPHSDGKCVAGAGPRNTTLDELASVIERMTLESHGSRRLLVAISGIDGSGKTRVATRLSVMLDARGVRTAVVGIDPWHTSRLDRFAEPDAARSFYENAFRWPELFSELVDPLIRKGSLARTFAVRRLSDDARYLKSYHFRDIAVVLLEGIFLLRREHVGRYDLRVWVDCDFKTALGRALDRNQEGVERGRLERDYREIYFPAQGLHFEYDRPCEAADLILPNHGGSEDA